jgi:tetratricopeptide (TPR) repeat protein
MRDIMRLSAILLLTALPFAANAAGSDDSNPPTPTETTTECKEGLVWDEKTKACVAPEDARLDNDTRFKAVRELAYADQPEAALRVLAAMTEGETDRVLTYKGFAHRKAGRIEEGIAYYNAALTQNPDNLLARSYMGQGLVEMGEMDLARLQRDEIRARGGEATWAFAALDRALRSGQTWSY